MSAACGLRLRQADQSIEHRRVVLERLAPPVVDDGAAVVVASLAGAGHACPARLISEGELRLAAADRAR
jgi:hypothetical protein